MLAVLVLVTNSPVHSVPSRTFRLEKCIARIAGSAPARCINGVGHAAGARSPTCTLAGIEGVAAHPVIAHAHDVTTNQENILRNR